LKLVIDTSVLMAYAKENALAADLMENVISNKVEWFICKEILKEYKIVLRIKKLKLNSTKQSEMLQFIADFAKNVELNSEVYFSRDRDDTMFLSLAEQIGADFLITDDKQLLSASHRIKSKIVNLKDMVSVLKLLK